MVNETFTMSKKKRREYMTSYSEFLTFTNNNEMGGEEN